MIDYGSVRPELLEKNIIIINQHHCSKKKIMVMGLEMDVDSLLLWTKLEHKM
jgi:hypothetical protein